MCYYPKPVIFQTYKAINKETGEIYTTKRPVFLDILDDKKVNAENALSDKIFWLPCGKCEECLLQRSSDYSIRAYLEAQNWPKNAFLTLTYNNDNLPKHRTLVKADLQKFWKKLRKRGYKIRYLACGEYGPNTRIGDHTITQLYSIIGLKM